MSRQCYARRQPKGFTLVELLVVIGIIALLISILLPTLGRAREAARNVKCLSNLKTIGQAILIYANSNHDYFPPGESGNGAATEGSGGAHWDAILQQALGRKGQIGNGLGNSAATASQDSHNQTGMLGEAFTCPSATAMETASMGVFKCHYSANPRLMPREIPASESPADLDYSSRLHPPPMIPLHKVSRVKNSTDMIVVGDGSQCVDNSQDTYNTPGNAQECFILTDYSLYYSLEFNYDYALRMGRNMASQIIVTDNADNMGGTSPKTYGMIRWRHQGNKSANFLFADGHAGAFSVGRTLGEVTIDTIPSYHTDLMRSNIYVHD